MFLSFDIGGTFIKYGVLQSIEYYRDIEVVKEKTTYNPIDNTKKIIEKILKENNIEKIGISIAANVNNVGEITNSTNLKIKDNFNLKKYFEDIFSIECSVLNDGNACALGCKALNEYKDYKNFVAITLGTGVGGGIVINNKLLTTENGFDSELGHIVVEENGLKCGCGKLGCVEAYCGSSGIVNRYNKLTNKLNFDITPNDIFEMFKSGNVNAKNVVYETGIYLGKAMAIISDIIGTDLFILNGGIAGFGKTMLDGVDKILKQRCFSRVKNKYPVVKINDFKYPALLGAIIYNNY